MKEWVCQITATGHLPGNTRRDIDDLLRLLGGKRVRVTIDEYEKPRSIKQNKFYHGPFIKAFQRCLLDCGQRVSCDDIHEGLRDAWAKNSYAIPLPDGSFLKVPPSTKRLSTTSFNDYLEEIRAHYAGTFGWKLPLVDEVPIEAYEQGR